MIKLEDMTPNIYYNKSRDFQYIGRLYDIVLNAVKTDSDTIDYINDAATCDSTLLNLLAMTLGFKARRLYNTVQLRAICCVLSRILKAKGSIKAVTIACDAILAAEGLKETADYSFTGSHLKIFLPYSLSDISLIEDLFDYILPAGLSCTIIRELKVTRDALTTIGIAHDVYWYIDDKQQTGDYTNALGVLADVNIGNIISNNPMEQGTIGNATIWAPTKNAANNVINKTTNKPEEVTANDSTE